MQCVLVTHRVEFLKFSKALWEWRKVATVSWRQRTPVLTFKFSTFSSNDLKVGEFLWR